MPVQVYKCAKLRSLDQREPPVTTLGTLVSRCQYLWFLEVRWQQTEELEWEAQQIRVAPDIPEAGMRAEGELVARMDWQNMAEELGKPAGEIGFSDLMMWANYDSSGPSTGFRWLSRYADRLAVMHQLPQTPLQLVRTDGGTCDLTHATVIARGHRSLVLRVQPSDDFVVKVGSDGHIQVEFAAHAKVDSSGCSYLRRAVPVTYGSVQGAGSGLSFIGLQGYCERNINLADLATDAGRRKYSLQVLLRSPRDDVAVLLHAQLRVPFSMDVAMCLCGGNAKIGVLGSNVSARWSCRPPRLWRPYTVLATCTGTSSLTTSCGRAMAICCSMTLMYHATREMHALARAPGLGPTTSALPAWMARDLGALRRRMTGHLSASQLLTWWGCTTWTPTRRKAC